MKIIIFFLVTLGSFSVSALSLRSLTDASVTDNIKFKGVSVAVVFQKDCSACQKQVQDLSCLNAKANLFLVGAFSSEEDLRLEYKIFNTKLPSFYGDQDFLKKFKVTEPVTPQILILNENKKVMHILGKTPCSKLLSVVKQVSSK